MTRPSRRVILLALKYFQINLKLLPLLRKDFQIKRLILHKPVIQVIRNKEGKFNFSTLGLGKEKKEKPKEPEKAERKNSRRLLWLY